MLADERYRHHDQRDVVCAGAFDFILGIGLQPLHRPDAALIADNVIGVRGGKAQAYCRRSTFHMTRIGIARLDDFPGQAMRGKQNPVGHVRRQFGNGAIGGAGDRVDKPARFGPAADIGCRHIEPGRCRCLGPDHREGFRRRGRKLRIKGQQDHPFGPPGRHVARHRIGKGMPVPHGDKHPEPVTQFGLQGSRLFFGFGQYRRLTADLCINPARNGCAPPGDKPGQEPPHRRRNPQDHRIRKQVFQERAHRFRAVGPPQIIDDDGGFAHPSSPIPGLRGQGVRHVPAASAAGCRARD